MSDLGGTERARARQEKVSPAPAQEFGLYPVGNSQTGSDGLSLGSYKLWHWSQTEKEWEEAGRRQED